MIGGDAAARAEFEDLAIDAEADFSKPVVAKERMRALGPNGGGFE